MIRLAIVDDSQESYESLSRVIERYEKDRQLKVFETEIFQQPDVFLEEYFKDRYDIVFLDILMTPISGTDLAKKIRRMDKKVVIVFTTGTKDSFPQALRCFDVHAFAYLNKPIQRHDIAKLLDDYFSYMHELEMDTLQADECSDPIPNTNILPSSVLYLEQRGNSTIIHANYVQEKIQSTLKNLKLALPDYFDQCHRAFIVNMKEIHRREKDQCVLKNREKIPIGSIIGKQFKKNYVQFLRSSMKPKF